MNAVRTLAAALLLFASGCAARQVGPYAPRGDRERDTRRADEYNRRAADLMNDRPEEAERLLLEALSVDIFHGPAHNNLGVVYLRRGRLYEAAGEFEWARKLMPGHPDPRVNLAITLERAGRTEDAMASYRAALEVLPGDIGALQGLTRIELMNGRTTAETRDRLGIISIRGESEAWRNWAGLAIARLRPAVAFEP